MPTKKIIQRQLPTNTGYTLIGIKKGSILDGQVSVCDNCNAVITNIATVRNSKGESFQVGVDCAQTLGGIKNSENFEMESYSFKKALRFFQVASLSTAKVWDNDKFYFYAEATSESGKKIKADTCGFDIEKYLPSYKEEIYSKSLSL